MVTETVRVRAEKIRLVLTDCDGVLTDGGVYYGESGERLKRFFIRDGMGVERLRCLAQIETGIITGELSPSVVKRAEKLRITELHLGAKDKSAVLDEILHRTGFAAEQVAYIGDDVNDLDVIRRVGLSACPNDAFAEVKGAVHWVLSAAGGHGAFRELAEGVLQAQL